MKQVILSLTLIFAMSWAFAQQGTITNIQVSQGAGETERVVDILFDLSGNDPLYDLALEVSFNDGDTYAPIDPGEVTGALTVSPGTGIHLVWDGRVSYAGIATDMARIRITATTWQCGNPITDIDGNIYNTVLIGTQCWMKENLKTTTYRNGVSIAYPGSDNTAWQNNTTGAYAIYPYDQIEGLNSDAEVLSAYGALYNWHAVNNPNGLCPTGWHVPTDAEFTAMTNHLGGASVAGGKMKSTRKDPNPHPRWNSPNSGATNESNWSGLPAGYRGTVGTSHVIGQYGDWWSSTEGETAKAWDRFLSWGSGNVVRDYSNKTVGFSVRCLRDN